MLINHCLTLLIRSCQWPLGNTRNSGTGLSSAILQYSPSSNSVSAAKSTCHDNWPVTSTKEEFLKNEIVVSFLERTQNEIVNSLKTSSDALSQERGSSEEPKSYSSESKIITTSTHQKPNISPVVKVCSEESCHWSVAFVEELANSLSLLRYGADVSHSWKLSVTTFHRDLEALKPASNGSDLIVSQQVKKSFANSK